MSSLQSARVISLILAAIEDLNLQLPPERKIPVSPDTNLASPEGLLDSMGMVILISCIEDRLRKWTGAEVILSNEGDATVLSQAFRTVRTLAAHVVHCANSTRVFPDKE